MIYASSIIFLFLFFFFLTVGFGGRLFRSPWLQVRSVCWAKPRTVRRCVGPASVHQTRRVEVNLSPSFSFARVFILRLASVLFSKSCVFWPYRPAVIRGPRAAESRKGDQEPPCSAEPLNWNVERCQGPPPPPPQPLGSRCRLGITLTSVTNIQKSERQSRTISR